MDKPKKPKKSKTKKGKKSKRKSKKKKSGKGKKKGESEPGAAESEGTGKKKSKKKSKKAEPGADGPAEGDEFLKVRVGLTNGGVRRFGFRIEIDPANGCLDPNEVTNLWVTVKPFSGANTSSNRVTIEWADSAPTGAAKKYSRDWFTGDCIVRRKNMALKYNE